LKNLQTNVLIAILISHLVSFSEKSGLAHSLFLDRFIKKLVEIDLSKIIKYY